MFYPSWFLNLDPYWKHQVVFKKTKKADTVALPVLPQSLLGLVWGTAQALRFLSAPSPISTGVVLCSQVWEARLRPRTKGHLPTCPGPQMSPHPLCPSLLDMGEGSPHPPCWGSTFPGTGHLQVGCWGANSNSLLVTASKSSESLSVLNKMLIRPQTSRSTGKQP